MRSIELSSNVSIVPSARRFKLDARAMAPAMALGAALLLTLGIPGCHRIGIRDSDDIARYDDEDDWQLPPSSKEGVDEQANCKHIRENLERLRSSKSRTANAEAKKGTVNRYAEQSVPSQPTSPSTTPKGRTPNEPAPQVVSYGPNSQSNPGSLAPDSNAKQVIDTGEREIDMEGAIAALPPNYRDLLQRQLTAIKNSGTTPNSQALDPTHPDASQLAANLDKPRFDKQKDAPKSPGVTARLSDHDLSAEPQVAYASTSPPGEVVAASATLPASPSPHLMTPSSGTPSSPIVNAVASSLADNMPTSNGSVTNSTGTWTQSVQQAVDQLEKQLRDFPPTDENLRISQEVALRMLYVAQRRLDDAVRPIDPLSKTESEFFRHQMLALYEASNPDAMPVRSRRWTLVMNSQREATNFLGAASNLEVRSPAFCTEVQGYGVVTRFAKPHFLPDQDVLLYCELENVAAEEVKEGFETQLQGSYEIVDAGGRRFADQLLQMEPEVCRNHRRDYFIVYRIYMPQQIPPGDYQLRLTIEDLKARKFGQANLDLRIKKP